MSYLKDHYDEIFKKYSTEKLLETYPALANYNLKRDNAGNSYITITSLKQLKQLVKEINQEIILSPYNDGIEIYDEYR